MTPVNEPLGFLVSPMAGGPAVDTPVYFLLVGWEQSVSTQADSCPVVVVVVVVGITPQVKHERVCIPFPHAHSNSHLGSTGQSPVLTSCNNEQ